MSDVSQPTLKVGLPVWHGHNQLSVSRGFWFGHLVEALTVQKIDLVCDFFYCTPHCFVAETV